MDVCLCGTDCLSLALWYHTSEPLGDFWGRSVLPDLIQSPDWRDIRR